MAKITGPAFSLSASKSLKKLLTFQRRPSGHAIYPHTKPGDREPFIPSPDQNDQRLKIKQLVEQWQSLSAVEKTAWDVKAKEVGYVGSGYHYFIHQNGGFGNVFEWSDSRVAWSDPKVGWSGY